MDSKQLFTELSAQPTVPPEAEQSESARVIAEAIATISANYDARVAHNIATLTVCSVCFREQDINNPDCEQCGQDSRWLPGDEQMPENGGDSFRAWYWLRTRVAMSTRFSEAELERIAFNKYDGPMDFTLLHEAKPRVNFAKQILEFRAAKKARKSKKAN